MSTQGPQVARPPRGGTRLVTSAAAPIVFTGNREVDSLTALTRGLKEYLEQLEDQMPGGRQLRLKEVLDAWSEPEQPAKYPSAVIYTTGAGSYDASQFTPSVSERSQLAAPDGRFVLTLAERVQELTVELWCTDPKERAGLAKTVEDALNPVDFMYGFRLDLPHYYGARASFELKASQFMDSEEEAVRRYRRVIFTIEGRVPLIKLVSYPQAKPSAKLTVIESELVVGDP